MRLTILQGRSQKVEARAAVVCWGNHGIVLACVGDLFSERVESYGVFLDISGSPRHGVFIYECVPVDELRWQGTFREPTRQEEAALSRRECPWEPFKSTPALVVERLPNQNPEASWPDSD